MRLQSRGRGTPRMQLNARAPEKPPKITVCGAPMRAQASSAMASSEPCPCRWHPIALLTPSDFSTFANLETSCSNCW